MAESEGLVLTAWQIYTSLFVMFWAAQLYLSSWWMTVICCVKFGLISQLVTDYMYRRGRYTTVSEDKLEVSTLVGMAKQERSLVPSLTALAKQEAGQTNKSADQSSEETADVKGEQVYFNEKSVLHERHERLRPSNL